MVLQGYTGLFSEILFRDTKVTEGQKKHKFFKISQDRI